MEQRPENGEDLGGEGACFAHLLCETCGALVTETHDELCGSDNCDARSTKIINCSDGVKKTKERS